ncbi:MAG: nicotinic acid mononucleotide adenylyltransferase [Planctomyces sp.]|nr:nicotinic acid mononucleotide adenylyltransferase [Planctomyces sp.]
MRIGIYGGTFDPVHLAHLVLAESCREQLSLDEVWFVPAAQPPHKPGRVILDPKHRIQMLKLAIVGMPHFRVEPIEIQRGEISYTVDTLRALHEKHPGHEFFLLMGADSLQQIHTWKDPAALLELATLGVVNRGRTPPPGLDDLPELASLVNRQALEKIQHVTMPGLDISATELRERVATGRTIRFLVPRAVEAYLAANRCYLPGG